MDKIFLITGAAGFLGRNICMKLLERNFKVRALVLPGDKAAEYIPKEVQIVEGNLCDVDSLEKFFSVPEGYKTIVIHCGSMVTVNPDYNKKLIEVNVDGTKNIIELCLSHKECQRMVYVGSTGSISEAPKGVKIKEVSSYDADLVEGWYSKSKAMASQAVLDAVHTRGLDACIVHPSGIMGPNDYSNSTTTRTFIEIINGQMPIGIAGSFNLADVRDLAEGCVLAALNGKRGESYILGNDIITFKELCSLIKQQTGHSSVKMFLPLRIAYFMAKKMEQKAKKTGTAPVMTTFSVYNLARNNDFDSSKAKSELGYSTRPYSQTVADEIKWLKKLNVISI